MIPIEDLDPVASINGFALPLSGWLKKYVDTCVRFTDAKPEVHFLSGLTIISSLLKRRISLPLAGHDIYPNIWCLIIASSGSRKSWGIKNAKRILEYLDYPFIPGKFTPEGLSDTFENWGHSTGVILADEFSSMTKYNQTREFASTNSEAMIQLYDCESFSLSLSASKGFRFIRNPYVVLLSATTPEVFNESATLRSLASGFSSRFIYLPLERLEKQPPPDRPNINPYLKILGDEITQIINNYPDESTLEFESKKAYKEYTEKYTELDQLGDNLHDTFLEGIGARYGTHFMKFLILISVSRNEEKISNVSIKEAYQTTIYFSQTMEKYFMEKVAFSELQEWTTKIEKILNKHYQKEWDDWFSVTILSRYTKLNKSQVIAALAELKSFGVVVEKKQQRNNTSTRVFKLQTLEKQIQPE